MIEGNDFEDLGPPKMGFRSKNASTMQLLVNKAKLGKNATSLQRI